MQNLPHQSYWIYLVSLFISLLFYYIQGKYLLRCQSTMGILFIIMDEFIKFLFGVAPGLSTRCVSLLGLYKSNCFYMMASGTKLGSPASL